MGRGRIYSDELKAKVIAEWQTEQTPKLRLAKKYEIPLPTVRHWLRGLTPVAMVTSENRLDIDALFTAFVAESLLALRTLAARAQDKVWIDSLEPRDAYRWYGVLADKVLAALAAYQSASERRGSGDESGV